MLSSRIGKMLFSLHWIPMGVHLEEPCPRRISCNAPVPYWQFFAVISQEGGEKIILNLFVLLETDAHPVKIHLCIIVTQSSSWYHCCFKTKSQGWKCCWDCAASPRALAARPNTVSGGCLLKYRTQVPPSTGGCLASLAELLLPLFLQGQIKTTILLGGLDYQRRGLG